MLNLFYTASLLLALQPLPLEHVNSWVALLLLHAYANNKLSFYVKKENACLIEEVIYHKEGDGSRIYHMIDFSHCEYKVFGENIAEDVQAYLFH